MSWKSEHTAVCSGLGGLDWNMVCPMIEQAFADLPDVQVLLYGPQDAPAANEMPIRTTRPKMTPARALFIKLMDQYSSLQYRRTLLEIQKLAYFLQEAGGAAAIAIRERLVRTLRA